MKRSKCKLQKASSKTIVTVSSLYTVSGKHIVTVEQLLVSSLYTVSDKHIVTV